MVDTVSDERWGLDYTESQRQVAPMGEYSVRFIKWTKEQSKKGKPMLVLEAELFNPPPGVTMEMIERAKPRAFISLAPNALFSLKELWYAAGEEIECQDCQTMYEAYLDKCPKCMSLKFFFNPMRIPTFEVRALVEVAQDEKGNDQNRFKTFSRKQ